MIGLPCCSRNNNQRGFQPFQRYHYHGITNQRRFLRQRHQLASYQFTDSIYLLQHYYLSRHIQPDMGYQHYTGYLH